MIPVLLAVGLGNPGREYAETRHNLGFRAVDALGEAFGTDAWEEKQKFSAVLREGRIGTVPLLLAKPLTFMNRSGEAVRKLLDFYRLDSTTNIIVLCDDIDLPIGTLRLRASGGPGTHNGLRSIVDHIGEAFPRIRIGIGEQPPGTDLAAYVLSVPPAEERTLLDAAIARIPETLRAHVQERGSPV